MGSKNTSDSPNKTVPGDCLYILPSFTAVWNVFLFPLYFLVLHTGFQRWRQNERSTVSHTDFFTYNLFLFEFLLFWAYVITSFATLQFDDHLMEYGLNLLFFTTPGVLSLHVLTCIERYLAVVYPVVYLSLRKQRWLRARNCIILIILVICVFWVCILRVVEQDIVPVFCLMGSVTGVIMFCSVQVLRALRNPSPGEGRGVSRSKRKAFFTMIAILSTHMSWFIGQICIYGIKKALHLEEDVTCKLELSSCFLEIPSSLVLPLLFLHRAKKLPKCRGTKSKNPGLELR